MANYNFFDWEKYINFYKLENIDSKEKAISHYLKHGKDKKYIFFTLKSQRQISLISVKNNIIISKGYQKFKIYKNNIYFDLNNLGTIGKEKAKNVLKIINKNSNNCNSLIDFGCAQGFFSFYAYFNNYKDVYMVEHDKEYMNNIKYIKNKLNLNINAFNKKFQEIDQKADIVLFLALIHWVFGRTETYNNFEDIIDKLYNITNKILVIEWIDNKDKTFYMPENPSSSPVPRNYNLENFKKSLKKFKKIEILNSKNVNRKLYVCYK